LTRPDLSEFPRCVQRPFFSAHQTNSASSLSQKVSRRPLGFFSFSFFVGKFGNDPRLSFPPESLTPQKISLPLSHRFSGPDFNFLVGWRLSPLRYDHDHRGDLIASPFSFVKCKSAAHPNYSNLRRFPSSSRSAIALQWMCKILFLSGDTQPGYVFLCSSASFLPRCPQPPVRRILLPFS